MDYKELAESAFKHAKIFKMEGELSKAAGLKRYVNAITDLLTRAEAAEQKVNELERALSDASKIVNTMQESTIPFYRRRAEEAEADNARLRELVEADRDGRCVVVTKCFECENRVEFDGQHYCKFWRMYCPDDSESYCKAAKDTLKGQKNG